MVDIVMNKGGEYFPSRHANVKVPVLMEVDIDFADALAEKGSALAAADVIKAITLPAGATILGGFVRVREVANSTTLTVDVGYNADADAFGAGVNAKTANASASGQTYGMAAAGNTVNVTLATLTGTLTAGKVTVGVLVVDARGGIRNGIAQLGS